MKHTHGEGVLFVALLVAFAACADPTSRAVGVSASKNILSPSGSPAPGEERAALTKIARLVAVSLDNEPARQQLKRDMRAAPFHEHKLELGTYLRSKDGKALLTRMVGLNRGTENDLFATLSTIRRLEFYMPVPSHREKWTGNGDVIVASELDESEPIVAFDKSGSEIAVDAKVAPTQPTLSIVPVETRFDQPMAGNSKNVRDENGAAIGTLEAATAKSANLISCDPDCGGGGSIQSPPPPPGLYLEFSRILDAKEPWVRGAPEIEVHIHGPTDLGNPRYGADLSCSGEHASDYKKVFDQNDGFWSGRVMLFSETEATNYNAKFKDGFDIIFWEDDNESCAIKTDQNELKLALEATSKGGIALATQLIKGTSWYLTAGLFLANVFSSTDWLLTNDDFLGIAVLQGNLGYAYPDNTHVIMDHATLNGRAKIVWR